MTIRGVHVQHERKVLHDIKARAAAAPDKAASTRGGAGWRGLEGTSFAAQEQQRAPQHVVPGATLHAYGTSRGNGRALLANAAPSDHESLDGASMAKRYLQVQQQAPGLADDAAWAVASTTDANSGGDVGVLRNPNAAAPKASGRKIALVIGNGDYEEGHVWSDLPFVSTDADAMAAHYRGRGFEVVHETDLPAAALRDRALALSKVMKSGDEAVLFYAGHGAPCGMVGVDAPRDAMPVNHVLGYDMLGALAGDAVAKGVSLQVIADCCYSGGLQSEVRDAHSERHAAQTMTIDSEAVGQMQPEAYQRAGYQQALERNHHQREWVNDMRLGIPR